MSKPASAKNLPVLVAVVAIGILVAAAVFWLRSFLGEKVDPPKQVVQEVRIVRPPPPPENEPPPPPPPEEKVDVPEPQQQPDPVASNEPPPGEQLGVDAQGSGAGDGFGLVGKPGGRDLLATGGSALAFYGAAIADELREQLNKDPETRTVTGKSTVRVRLWIKPSGEVERANLIGSSGDAARDHAIEGVLSRLPPFSRGPPANTPLPIVVRLVPRV